MMPPGCTADFAYASAHSPDQRANSGAASRTTACVPSARAAASCGACGIKPRYVSKPAWQLTHRVFATAATSSFQDVQARAPSTGRASEQPRARSQATRTPRRVMSFRERADVGDQPVNLVGPELVLVGVHLLFLAVALLLDAIHDGGADLLIRKFLLPRGRAHITHALFLALLGLRLAVVA